MSSNLWTTERRRKASIAYGDTVEGQTVTPLSRGDRRESTDSNDMATIGSGEVSYQASFGRDESAADSEEEETPGAYAVTRSAEYLDTGDEEWDPTEQEPAALTEGQQLSSTRGIGHAPPDDDDGYKDEPLSDTRTLDDTALIDAHVDYRRKLSDYGWFRYVMIGICILVVGTVSAGIGAAVALSKEVEDDGGMSETSSIPDNPCDFSDEESPDPFRQCSCHESIVKISDVVENTYHELKQAKFLADQGVSELPINSCQPENLALVWLATEILSLDEDGVVDGEDFIAVNTLKNRWVLACLYASWGGKYWKSQGGWLSSPYVCSWNGISCNERAAITELKMYDNNATGTLPAAMELLQDLRVLDLRDNGINGTLPDHLWRLTHLEEIYLVANRITGQLPSSIGSASAITKVHLTANKLTGSLPRELLQLSNLEEFVINENKVQGSLPRLIGVLTNLELLKIDSTFISGPLPESMMYLTNLKSIHGSNNELSGTIPSFLGNVTSLEFFDVSWTEMYGMFPENVGQMTGLKSILLEGLKLTGTIPADFGLCTGLESIYLGGNRFSGTIPSELGHLSNIMIIDVKLNPNLSGTLPTELGNLSSLEQLHIQETAISGKIPSMICETGQITITGSKILQGPCPCCIVEECKSEDDCTILP